MLDVVNTHILRPSASQYALAVSTVAQTSEATVERGGERRERGREEREGSERGRGE